MNAEMKNTRYKRITKQIEDLIFKTEDPFARMSTIAAVLHHKFDYYFWTGFYRLVNDELIACCYQGNIACLVLPQNTGVCWEAINRKETVIISDVNQFPNHIACDSRSKSEIVVPMKNRVGEITAVLDVDSKELNSFDKVDAENLEKIVALIYQKC
ncbi:MAG: GAF domain-containing protein [Armatimonadetes bacterium]|nr:GAF domain-containing protein [Armatimonadota bacterium]